NIAQDQGEYEEARRLYQQSLNVFERLGDRHGQAEVQHELGNIAFLQREYEEARHFYLQSLEIKERLGIQRGRAVTLQQLGLLAYEQGNLEDALMYTAPAYILSNALRSPYRATTLRILARIRSHMDEVSFTTQWQMLAGDHPLPTLSNEGTQQPLLQVV